MERRNLIGHRPFGRLHVIAAAEDIVLRSGKIKTTWACLCECGSDRIVIVTTGNLTSGNTLSCGCIRDFLRTIPRELGGLKPSPPVRKPVEKIRLVCKACPKEFFVLRSRAHRQYCSPACAAADMSENQKSHQFLKGHIPWTALHPEERPRGTEHWEWKGERVGYRGLHYWLRRVKGVPQQCVQCGKQRTTPRSIHWANIDGQYRRDPDDFIALCASCHRIHDLNLRRITNQDALDTTLRLDLDFP